MARGEPHLAAPKTTAYSCFRCFTSFFLFVYKFVVCSAKRALQKAFLLAETAKKEHFSISNLAAGLKRFRVQVVRTVCFGTAAAISTLSALAMWALEGS